MPKIAKELSAIEVKRLNTDGMHFVGGVAGLILQISNDGKAKSWLLRVRAKPKRLNIGLGPYPQTSLAEARAEAKLKLSEVKSGVNPISTKKRAKSELAIQAGRAKSFIDCAEAYMKAKAAEYKNEKHAKQWRTTLNTYVYPIIGRLLVADISRRNILDVLEQEIKDPKTKKSLGSFWEVRTETATRVQQRMKAVFDYALVNEYRTTVNPATWEGYLDTLLPSPKKIKTVQHHPAVPYTQIGGFMVELRKKPSIGAKALEFLIHTVVRSGSVREARWADIDFEDKVWTIPAEHTKTKQEHRVPLSPQAVKLLKELQKTQKEKGTESFYIFPSPTKKTLSDMALSEIMRGMLERGELKNKAVPHGFRSTFKDWAADKTNHQNFVSEMALGHAVGGTEGHYRRGDLFEKRRKLMNDWSKLLDSPWVNKTADVIPLKRKA
ncbi:tyrosine-type recombinase/integrase [Polynucleobacter sp. AP-Nickl1-40-C4]|uniref:tyrosine-type recombinase/integrase n=1 Tax=Polynucleobacter sp. AP-Nickl1-40-C4 TaxID=3108275 RepID=UPI002B2241E9|nr:tyrosine-type recombinase/integrase [Polynucleobacter sp. AP-Nickl1-40-C4]MEA9567540.1 tyrosine-type recombinase/integrase [Polynucleobacter sp. AP-Nickl1-40-C4]